MDIDNLVRMANQIGDYFASCSECDEAEIAIANHLKLFWAPQMRQELLNHIALHPQTHSLQTQVAQALTRHLNHMSTSESH